MDICEVYPKVPPYQISGFSPILNSRVHYLKGDPLLLRLFFICIWYQGEQIVVQNDVQIDDEDAYVLTILL